MTPFFAGESPLNIWVNEYHGLQELLDVGKLCGSRPKKFLTGWQIKNRSRTMTRVPLGDATGLHSKSSPPLMRS